MEMVMEVSAEQKLINARAKRGLLWFGIISIVMLFAGLTSAYVVRQGEGKWVVFDMPQLFLLSTIIILMSSATMQWAVTSAKKGNNGNLKIAVAITTVFGIGFVVSQYYAWSDLVSQGIYFVGRVGDITGNHQYISAGNETAADVASMGNVAGSFLYAITGLHVAHLVVGVISLFVVFSRALMNKYSADNYNGIRVCAIYWHFLDGLWVYLYLFLLYIR
jgi:cytochrome c oxidase subunit 3